MDEVGIRGTTPRTNHESWYLDPDADPQADRPGWRCLECPLKDQCSDKAWKRAKAWSWESAGQALDYVRGHLTFSDHHKACRSEVKADAMDRARGSIEEFSQTHPGLQKQRSVCTEACARMS